MLKEYQISNFKAFDGPETVPIKPITLIFGPNSSGKSSILQSLLMLKQTLDDRENPQTPLLFKGDLADLGSYRELIHRHEVGRSFSFKIALPMQGSLDEPFQYPWIVSAWGEGGLSDLEESLKDFHTVAIRVAFSHDSDRPVINVSEIDLFLGDDPLPVISYEREPFSSTKDRPANYLKVKGLNERHAYWASHWKTFDEADDSYVLEIVDPVKAALRAVEKMSPEARKDYLNKLKEELALLKRVAMNEVTGTVEQDTPQLSPEEKDRIASLEGLQLALEAYKKRSKSDVLELHRFLPERLNNREMSDIITAARDDDESSRNISVLTLTVGRLVRRALEQILYIGPLRSYPERYFMFGGVSAFYVGKSGKFVPDILVSDRELLTKLNDQLERFNLGYELKLSSLSDQSSDIQDLFALRLYEKSTGIHVGMTDVGFGFSQVLPIIVQCLLSKQSMILMEQPELHLHPRLQAELGDLFIDSALGESKNHLLIETHSEHVLLRIMRRMRETSDGTLPHGIPQVTPKDVCIIFVQPREGSSSAIRHLELDAEGLLLDPWPGGFFEEGYRERFA